MDDSMKLIKISDKQIIVFLILVSYLVRIILSPFFIMFPHIPHDFYAYVGSGKCMAEGKYLMFVCTAWGGRQGEISVYGPFFGTLMMFWYLLFGEFNFFMYKIPSIIFDTLNVLMIYFIGKKLFNKKLAFYLSLLYCFSFITLYNSAVLGNDDMIAMFFVLGSLYFLIDKKLSISAGFSSVSIMFKIIGIVSLPAVFYYIFRKYGLNTLLKYILLLGIVYFIFLSPFILIAGPERALFYIFGSSHTTKQTGGYMSFYNIFNYATNINVDFLILPIVFLSYLITFCLFFIRKLKNHEMELFRNITLLWIASLLFGGILVAPQQYLIFVFLLILIGYHIKKKNSITQVIGGTLIFISLLVISVIYRWGVVQYSSIDRILFLSITITSPLGVFLLLNNVKMDYRIIWTFIILAVVIFETSMAAPLLALPLGNIANRLNQFVNFNRFGVVQNLYGDHIQGNPEVFLAYAVSYGGPAVILWICLILLYYTLSKKTLGMGKGEYFR